MRRLVCRLVGHDPASLTVGAPGEGGGRLEACLRCHATLSKEEYSRDR